MRDGFVRQKDSRPLFLASIAAPLKPDPASERDDRVIESVQRTARGPLSPLEAEKHRQVGSSLVIDLGDPLMKGILAFEMGVHSQLTREILSLKRIGERQRPGGAELKLDVG
jgi:hypothetical protein